MPVYFHIACTIERGGFTTERTFEINTHDGKIIGTAYIEHLCGADKKPLPEDEPQYGEKLDGFVKCRKIRDIDESTVLVEVPSADVVHVSAKDLIEVECG